MPITPGLFFPYRLLKPPFLLRELLDCTGYATKPRLSLASASWLKVARATNENLNFKTPDVAK